MNNEEKFEHALISVLYAAKLAKCDLAEILENVRSGIIGNSIRPRPQDQDQVIRAVEDAINDVEGK